MADRPDSPGSASVDLIVTGLGPGDLDRLPPTHRALLTDPDRSVVVRTLHHPAAAQLAELRPVRSCDDLYDTVDTFEGVYDAIAARVMESAASEPTIYAVPGSPLMGEFAVRKLLELCPDAEVFATESFVDAVLVAVGYDPFDRGLRILNGHDLPHPLVLDSPAVVGHLDAPEVLAEVAAQLSRVLPEGASVTLCAELGTATEQVMELPLDQIPAELAGFRTSLFVDGEPAGLIGAIQANRRLRRECPWDREQTHRSLVRHLLEEANELVEAIADLPGDEIDHVAYGHVEEELGDVLLQVLFHAVIAEEAGAFDLDDVGTRLREKLVRRHPHVFGDVVADDVATVESNWAAIKQTEKDRGEGSVLDRIPGGLGALERAAALGRAAARVGFDWDDPMAVLDAVKSEVEELDRAIHGEGDPGGEAGDVVLAVVNLIRHLGQDPEVVAHAAATKFERRFRRMEGEGSLVGLSEFQLEQRWQRAKEDD